MSVIGDLIRSFLGLAPDDPERLAMVEMQKGADRAANYMATENPDPLCLFPAQDPALVMVCNTCLDPVGRPAMATGNPPPYDAKMQTQRWYEIHPTPDHDSHVTYTNERRRGDRRRM